MGWLMQRSVKIDNLTVKLDVCSSTKIGTDQEPPQPTVFVLETKLPFGLNDRPGYILCKTSEELLQSGGPYHKVIEPAAFAFEGDSQWTEQNAWDIRWDLASFVIPLGNHYVEDEHGGWQERGYRGIHFVPHRNKNERKAYYCYWISTGYNGEGYWGDYEDKFACQWREVEAICAEEGHENPLAQVEEITVLPPGDQLFLGRKAVAA